MEYGHFKRRDGGGGGRDFGGRDRYRDNRDYDRGRGFDRGRDFRGRDDNRYGSGGGGDRFGSREQDESVFSKRVRAGKRRTYFFDVRKTRGEDYFITITESTRREEGFGYKRHKIFLYKEDFNRFVGSLNEVVNHVKTNLMPDFDYEEFDRRQAEWEAQNRDAANDDDVDDHHHDEEVEDEEDNDAGSRKKLKDDDEMSW